jgi:peptidoglycan hydrolase-like protein with peptidoglycan-binding domain
MVHAIGWHSGVSLGLVLLVIGAMDGAVAQGDQATPERGPLPGVAATPTPTPALPPAAGGASGLVAAPAQHSQALSKLARIYVAALQRALPSHGYHPGPETGRLDRATAAAIRAYQRDAGLQEDPRGEMSLKTTLDSVNFARPPVLAAPTPP